MPDVLAVKIGNYLRLSGLYQQVFAGNDWAQSEVHSGYENAFTAKTYTITYLAPIQFIEFGAGPLDCGAFLVRRFSDEELQNVLRNPVKRVFYPDAYIDSEKIKDYWFISGQETVPLENPLSGDLRIVFHTSGGPHYPRAVTAAINNLMLYNWQADPSVGLFTSRRRREAPEVHLLPVGNQLVLARPRIPVVISVSDNLIQYPLESPDLSVLGLEVAGDSPIQHEGKFHKLLLTKDEEGSPFSLSKVQNTVEFTAFVKQISTMLAEADARGWNFVNTALQFLLEAFTSDAAEGFLWSITAIEALVGERVNSGISKLLRNRVLAILGSTPEKVKELKRLFDDLYDFRSRLVHGSRSLDRNPANFLHAKEAWDMARGIFLWMLGYLSYTSQLLPKEADQIPRREDLLKVLDMNAESRRHTATLLQLLPGAFPNITDWFTAEPRQVK